MSASRKLPPRWRPFARRRALETATFAEGQRFQAFLWDLTQARRARGQSPSIPLGVVTREGYQGGMDEDLARYLAR